MSPPALPGERAAARSAHVKTALTHGRTLLEQAESALVSRTARPTDTATVAQLT